MCVCVCVCVCVLMWAYKYTYIYVFANIYLYWLQLCSVQINMADEGVLFYVFCNCILVTRIHASSVYWNIPGQLGRWYPKKDTSKV